ncbi:paraquat-inducible protein A [Nitrospirillum amazonense]|uniref:Paraquat-inducible protein A n=1 Tax=Nitrospirillum amazonense TaxID=28077 RepID=A0A560K2K1_9PROT|nr:paraquat-inducible protein A [Nitrospirillum amazonense]MDG3443971.1 paraquat-inducible protein A [Nitrospirillum amazonense]TWB77532.1 paraquat-inducible protein A [Nitrospirillum amazonense]
MSAAPTTSSSEARVTTAAQAGLVACPHCHLVCRDTAARDGYGDGRVRCPRCAGRLHPRKVDSLSRTWALLIAAAILYIPANAFPVMQTSTLLSTQNDTILSGILYFWNTGSPELAVLIFTVSILVPLLKLATLSTLAVSIQRGARSRADQRARLYRIVEFVGRWSMLDVFVVALMVGLVHFQGLAVIQAGPGAAAFGAVVVLTMLAAHSFDPRMIWDRAHRPRRGRDPKKRLVFGTRHG